MSVSVVVVGFLGGVVVEFAVKPLCVPPVHPAQESPLNLGQAFPSVSVDEFVFIRAIDALG